MNEELSKYVSLAEGQLRRDPTLTGAEALLQAIELVRTLALIETERSVAA